MAQITIEVPAEIAAKIDKQAHRLLLNRRPYIKAIIAAVANSEDGDADEGSDR
ncbi:MAG: hypothetical protein H0W96_07940 [Solirubrobacterales bacterium]|nr:hypothetical protein [Solirubrobacterales bacterium]